jgi:hypothetical protein
MPHVLSALCSLRNPLLATLAAAACQVAVCAQTWVARGDIVAAGNAFLAVMSASGQTSTAYPMPPGTSAQSVLWDPSEPDSFLVGKHASNATGGELYRMRFTGPGQVTTSLVMGQGFTSGIRDLCWHQDGRQVVVLTQYSQVHRVHATTGAVAAVTSGSQPWGFNARCLAIDPLQGDLYVGDYYGGIWRIASGTGGVSAFGTGVGNRVDAVLVDDSVQPRRLVCLYWTSTGQALVSMSLQDPSQRAHWFGSVGTPRTTNDPSTAAFDQQGRIVLSDYHDVERVAAGVPGAAGQAPTPVGSFAFPSGTGYALDLAVVGGTTRPFRTVARAQGVLGAHLALENVPPQAMVGFVLPTTSTWLPVDTGPMFGIVPDLLTMFVTSSAPTPGGQFAWIGTPPPPLTLPNFAMAAFHGQTWDLVGVAFGPAFEFLGRTNVARVTWQ